MGIVINPESEYAKELAKWDTPKRMGGMGPNGFEEYPRMLYIAKRLPNGKPGVMMDPPSSIGWTDAGAYTKAVLDAESFTASCQRIVNDRYEHDKATKQGWRPSPQEALDAFEAEQQDVARAAAETAFAAQRMSDTARRELAEADEGTSEHVTDVVGKRGPGRPRKVQEPAA